MALSIKEYHLKTAYCRYNMEGHFLDWTNQPSVYKNYLDTETISLSKEFQVNDILLSRICKNLTLKKDGLQPDSHADITLDTLNRIIQLSYRITRTVRYRNMDICYRSVPSAGALYPFELYIASQNVANLKDGLYHYDIQHHELKRLRKENIVVNNDGTALILFITVIFFRSSWKYRTRSYRYHLLDTGHLVENLTLALKALSLPFKIDYDFDDNAINSMLGLDIRREVCLAMIQIPDISKIQLSCYQDLPENFKIASQVAAREIFYPMIEEFHASSSTIFRSEIPITNIFNFTKVLPSVWTRVLEPDISPEIMSYSDAVSRRKSSRNFVKMPLSKDCFSLLITLLCQKEKDDIQDSWIRIGFAANHVEGISPGCYWLNREDSSIALSQQDSMQNLMPHICLGQEWLSQAPIYFFFIINLEELEKAFGTRGYRYAMISAGRMGERIYLGATTMGLGCCGIGAFYDDEASALLDLNNNSVMVYLVAAGTVKLII